MNCLEGFAVKLFLPNGQIRRFSFSYSDKPYSGLMPLLKKISPKVFERVHSQKWFISYQDEECDWIQISTNEEFTYLLSRAGDLWGKDNNNSFPCLRLHIFIPQRTNNTTPTNNTNTTNTTNNKGEPNPSIFRKGDLIRLQSMASKHNLRILDSGKVDGLGGNGPLPIFRVYSHAKREEDGVEKIILQSNAYENYFLGINEQKELTSITKDPWRELFVVKHEKKNDKLIISLRSAAHGKYHVGILSDGQKKKSRTNWNG